MKVLFITNIPVPYRIDFYNELGKMVDLTVIFEAKGAEDQGIHFNYNFETISNFKAIFLSEGNIKEKKVDIRIFKYLRESYDQIVLTSYSYLTEMMVLIYLKLRKIPYFLSSDGGIIKFEEIRLKKYYKCFLISGAIGYFSPSKKSDEYLSYYGADLNKIHRYPFTSYKRENQITDVISDDVKSSIKKELGIKEKYLILGVGQFIYRKGWDLLLKAMKNMPDDYALYLIGGQPTEEYFEIIRANGLQHIYFKNFLSNNELAEYYRAADVFVLPTREDIWGLVINEAMAYGLPIITTKQCMAGLELVLDGENGYLIDINNGMSCFESKIDKLLSNDEARKEFGNRSLNIIKGYTIEEMALAYYTALI